MESAGLRGLPKLSGFCSQLRGCRGPPGACAFGPPRRSAGAQPPRAGPTLPGRAPAEFGTAVCGEEGAAGRPEDLLCRPGLPKQNVAENSSTGRPGT